MPKNVKFVLMQEAQSDFDQLKQAFTTVPIWTLQTLSLLRLMLSATSTGIESGKGCRSWQEGLL